MKVKTTAAHVLFITAGLAVILLVPFMCTDTFKNFAAGQDADTVTSASVIIDQPAGEYIVFINKTLHTDEEKLADWIRFFNGEEVSYIFEDISCSVAESDPGAVEMGESYRSRLPENQMQLKTEDPVLLVSREESNLFDIMIMSAEFADAYNVTGESSDTVEVLMIEKAEETKEETDADENTEQNTEEQGV